MKNRVIASLVALGALSLSACSSSQADNLCTLWAADNGPYLVKYTAKAGTDATCVASQGLDGQYEGLQAQLYPLDNGTRTEVVLLPVNAADTDPVTGDRLPQVKLATGDFATVRVDGNNQCAVPTLTPAANAAADLQYTFSNLVFSEDAFSQGTSFQGDVAILKGGCTANYTVTALAPTVNCASNDDCLPVADPAKGRPFSSGIAGNFHTYCDLGAAATAFTGDSATGVCFLADPFPSFCPNGAVEGEAGSACPVGK